MGIYIPKMEKPDDCRDCYFCKYHNDVGMTVCHAKGRLLARDRKTIHFDGTPDWCPLVYLNTPLTRYFDKQVEKNENIHGC